MRLLIWRVSRQRGLPAFISFRRRFFVVFLCPITVLGTLHIFQTRKKPYLLTRFPLRAAPSAEKRATQNQRRIDPWGCVFNKMSIFARLHVCECECEIIWGTRKRRMGAGAVKMKIITRSTARKSRSQICISPQKSGFMARAPIKN